jgi:hypothetical protein
MVDCWTSFTQTIYPRLDAYDVPLLSRLLLRNVVTLMGSRDCHCLFFLREPPPTPPVVGIDGRTPERHPKKNPETPGFLKPSKARCYAGHVP